MGERLSPDARETQTVARLEDLTRGALVRGVVADSLVTVVDVTWHGADTITLTYTLPDGTPANRLLFREDESAMTVVEEGRAWAFDGDADDFRLASEAKRISLAYLFDPYVAVSTSQVEPLPHQITAVYERMLPLQPLSFLLADDQAAVGEDRDGAPGPRWRGLRCPGRPVLRRQATA